MILHDPIVVPSHLAHEFERVCDTCFVNLFKYEDQSDGMTRYTMSARSPSQVEKVFSFMKGLAEYQREYDHYNNEIKNYVWQYRVEKIKRYGILILIYLALLILL